MCTLVKVIVYPECIPWTLGVRQQYTIDETPVHHAHVHPHSVATVWHVLSEVWGNQRNLKKTPMDYGNMLNVTQAVTATPPIHHWWNTAFLSQLDTLFFWLMLLIITEKSFSGRTWGSALEHSSAQWEYHWALPSIQPGVLEKSESCGRPLWLLQKKRKQQRTSLIKRSPRIQLLLTFSTEFSKMGDEGFSGTRLLLNPGTLKET